MWQRMQARAVAVAAGNESEVIWSCEHEPVYTTGRRGVDNRTQPDLGAPLIATDRGGETTFHGPGQLMLYPVINLRTRGISPRAYVALLEDACMSLLLDHGVQSERKCGLPGVWTEEGKIAALGLRISHGVAYHGMALNVSVDLSWFRRINPCGTGQAAVSLEQYAPGGPSPEKLAAQWAGRLQSKLGLSG